MDNLPDAAPDYGNMRAKALSFAGWMGRCTDESCPVSMTITEMLKVAPAWLLVGANVRAPK